VGVTDEQSGESKEKEVMGEGICKSEIEEIDILMKYDLDHPQRGCQCRWGGVKSVI